MLDRSTPPPVYMMGNLTLPVLENEVLPNGVTLYRICGGTQNVNQLTIIFKGGASESDNPAVARLMGTMLREGTASMSGADISEALDFNGAMLRIGTDGHITSINISSLNSKTIAVLPLLRSIICEPTFPEPTLALYRDIDAKEFMISQTKVMTLSNQLLAKMIKGEDHPQAKVSSVEEILSVTSRDLHDFYSKVVTADGCMAFLSGNITDEIYAEVKSMLESLPVRGKAMKQLILPFQPKAPGYEVIEKSDAVQAAVNIGIPAIARSHPDYVPLRFTVIALGGYFGSRLMKNIREDKGYTYGIGAYLLGSQDGSYILIAAQTDKKYVSPLIEEVKNELVRMSTEPLTDDELIRLRQYISSTLMETLDSPFSIMDYYKTIECVGLPKGYFNSQVDWVHRIDQKMIAEMAAKYLLPDQMRIAVCQ